MSRRTSIVTRVGLVAAAGLLLMTAGSALAQGPARARCRDGQRGARIS
jgi:hypothetical protein